MSLGLTSDFARLPINRLVEPEAPIVALSAADSALSSPPPDVCVGYTQYLAKFGRSDPRGVLEASFLDLVFRAFEMLTTDTIGFVYSGLDLLLDRQSLAAIEN